MPMSLLAGEAWLKSRQLLWKSYSDLIVVTIAGAASDEMSFSADTDIAECLIIGTKRIAEKKRATFVVLRKAPRYVLQGGEISRVIKDLISFGNLRSLEDGPLGGSSILVGDETEGHAIDAPTSEKLPWPIARISDLSLAQTCFQLTVNKRLWLPTQIEEEAIDLPLTTIAKIGAIGPYHMDINGTERSGRAVRGPFDIVPVSEAVPTFPALWAHDAQTQRMNLAEPDRQAIMRRAKSRRGKEREAREEDEIIAERAKKISESASHCHFNRDFQFNSQSTVAYTERLSIGGRAWPSIKFQTKDKEKAAALWANSTLGALLYWNHSNKQQSGRGSIPITSLPELTMLAMS
jgi:hypothetical protein